MANKTFDTANKTFENIIAGGPRYTVPKFQRDYSWKEEQWSDLWNDIITVLAEKDEEHYMGYLVLQRKDNEMFTIIDGQQRITTITLLILAALYRLKELEQTDPDSQKRSDVLRASFIGNLHPVSLVIQNKLTLNRNNNDYFSRYLCRLDKPPVRKIKSSERLLSDACLFFQDKIKLAYSASSEEIADFIHRMAGRLLFTTITVGSDVNAYKVFETLNARGVQLSTPDLLKNYLFSIIDNQNNLHRNEIVELETSWAKTSEQLGKNDFTKFVFAEWNRRNSLTGKSELFKKIKNTIIESKDAFDYLRELEQSSEIYGALQDENDEFWQSNDYCDVKEVLYVLKLFNIVQPQGILLSAYQKYDKHDFLKLAGYLKAISIRYNVICQKSPNEQEKLYNQLATNIYKEIPLTEIKPLLKKVYPSDNEFESAFKSKQMPDRQTHKKIRYLLKEIERKCNSCLRLDESLYSLEHILPKNPNEKWYQYFGEDDIDKYSNRLGNMTLVTASENKDLEQKSFGEKKSVFQKASLSITKNCAQYETWDAEAIESRQAWMAKQALSVWRIDF